MQTGKYYINWRSSSKLVPQAIAPRVNGCSMLTPTAWTWATSVPPLLSLDYGIWMHRL